MTDCPSVPADRLVRYVNVALEVAGQEPAAVAIPHPEGAGRTAVEAYGLYLIEGRRPVMNISGTPMMHGDVPHQCPVWDLSLTCPIPTTRGMPPSADTLNLGRYDTLSGAIEALVLTLVQHRIGQALYDEGERQYWEEMEALQRTADLCERELRHLEET